MDARQWQTCFCEPKHIISCQLIITFLVTCQKLQFCQVRQLNDLSVRMFIMVHYNDAIMGSMASEITSLTIVYSAVYSGADQRKHQSSASLAFVRGIHRGPVNSPHKGPVTRKMFPFDDVIMFVCDGSCLMSVSIPITNASECQVAAILNLSEYSR